MTIEATKTARTRPGDRSESRQNIKEPLFESVWPLSPRNTGNTKFASRLDDLSGKTIATVWSWMWGGDDAFMVIREALTARYPGIRFIPHDVFGNIHGADEDNVVAALPGLLREHGVDGVLLGIANCGSCSPAVLRAHLVCERAGFPAVSIVGEPFVPQATAVAEYLGVAGAAMAIYPGNIEADSKALFRQKCSEALPDAVIAGLTLGQIENTAQEVEPAPREAVFYGSLDETIEHFEAQQWSDGLPFVPPSVERVEEFLRFTPRSPDEVLGVLQPANRRATIWSIAVNGVMAGCRPEYMPLLVAAVDAMCDPDFRQQDQSAAPAWEMLLIVSGPIAKQLRINHGRGVCSTGSRPNTSIGRFLRLYTRNIAGLRLAPGHTDHAGIGNSFLVAIAEDEDAVRAIGWPTIGEDRGAAPNTSVVTLQGVVAASPTFLYAGAINGNVENYIEPLKRVFGDAMCGYWGFTGAIYGQWHPLILLCPEMARIIAEAGWSKNRLRQYLYDNCRVEAGLLERYGECNNLNLKEQVEMGFLPPLYHESDDPQRLVPVFIRPEWINIVVAGLPTTFFRGYMNSHEQGVPTTRQIELPDNWNDLLEDAQQGLAVT